MPLQSPLAFPPRDKVAASDAPPEIGSGEIAAEADRVRSQTLQHLRDIESAHGAHKRWVTLTIPQGRLLRIRSEEPYASGCGSTAALCAAEGEPAID